MQCCDFGALVKVSGGRDVQAEPCTIDQHQRGEKNPERKVLCGDTGQNICYVHGMVWMGLLRKLEGRVWDQVISAFTDSTKECGLYLVATRKAS